MNRVLDTAALLHWPVPELSGGICAFSQLDELASVSETRSLLLESAQIEWRAVHEHWLEEEKAVASAREIYHDFQMLIWMFSPLQYVCLLNL